MEVLNKIKYLFSKGVLYIQIPSIRASRIDKTSKIGHRCNLINVDFGKYSYCGNNCTFNNVSVGSFCSIASYCSVGGGNHPLNQVSTSPVFYEKENCFKKSFCSNNVIWENKKTYIGNDVWIGENCFIKEGVAIGNGAVIGAHSVVTKDVPSYAVVAGVPATIIKYRFDKVAISQLENIKWWDWDDQKLMDTGADFSDIQKFLDQFRGK